jgi:hypothetical protein
MRYGKMALTTRFRISIQAGVLYSNPMMFKTYAFQKLPNININEFLDTQIIFRSCLRFKRKQCFTHPVCTPKKPPEEDNEGRNKKVNSMTSIKILFARLEYRWTNDGEKPLLKQTRIFPPLPNSKTEPKHCGLFYRDKTNSTQNISQVL